ncbi:MAG TPA: helix-turn-helix domain-containing protein [Anaerolineae bacterium]|nr:helix-turn-helix domain-containing protein [Anaerolineae bacterium]
MSKKSISLNNLIQGNPTSNQERADAAANRQLILAEAEQLFAEQGVGAVTMADIAKAAGVGKGTLYRRFGNKGELCYHFLDEHMRSFQEDMLGRMRFMTAEGVSVLEQLDMFLDALVYFTEEHMPLLCEVQAARGDDGDDILARPHFWLHMTITGLLQQAVRQNLLEADIDVVYMADALMAPLSPTVFRFQREVHQFDLERISAGLRRLAAGLARG